MSSPSPLTVFPLLSSIILLLPHLSYSLPTVPLPFPPGPTNVHITTFALTDHSRLDPYGPPSTPRRIMVSLFQPTVCPHTILTTYAPPYTAALFDAKMSAFGIPNGTIESFRLQTCPSPPDLGSHKNHPLALFSPGLGTSRLNYNVLLQWISSTGFNIISIDHPYDADVVEFPDGTIIHAVDNFTADGLLQDLSVRVADARFVLDALSSPPKPFASNISLPLLDSRKTVLFGHSFGGATAADALLVDHRFAAGLNMDGSIYGPADNTSDTKPFLLFAASNHNQTGDATWASFWRQLKGWKLQLQVSGTRHGSFTDYPVMAKALGIDPAGHPDIAGVTGTIDGERMLEILSTYVGAFFQSVLKGKNRSELQTPSKAFPEVSFENASFVGAYA